MFKNKSKGYIVFFVCLSLLTFVNAADYVSFIDKVLSYPSYVNTTGILNADQTYVWAVNITGTNVSSVTINGNAMVNAVSSTKGTWSVALLPSAVADFGSNCTYTPFTITIVNVNASGSTFTNTSTQNNLTVLPCIETSSVASSLTVSDSDTASLNVADSTVSNSLLWMKGLTFNSTNSSCYYGCTNVMQCKVDDYFLGGITNSEYCLLEVNRSASDVGVVVVDVDQGLSLVAPSNIPAALIGGFVGVILTVAVTRIKRRGGVKEA